MHQSGRTRGKTWASVALFAVGAHGGVMTYELLDPTEDRCAHARSNTTPSEPDERNDGGAVRCVHEFDDPRFDIQCFIDPAALSAEHMPFPRGLRLLPGGGGLRLDGARGLTTRLGLRTGDVLLAIDGHRLNDGQDLDVLADAVHNGGFTLHYRRRHREHRLRITIVGTDA